MKFDIRILSFLLLTYSSQFDLVNGHKNSLRLCHLGHCPIVKLEPDYIHKGRVSQLGNLTIYETADMTPKRLLIAVHDIFGNSPHLRTFADIVAETYGFRVVAPDFFRGEGWDTSLWPPNLDDFNPWLDRVANWDTIVQYDIKKLLSYYKSSLGIKQIGIFGFCWGGTMSNFASIKFPEIKVVGLIHPSDITIEMVQDIQAPTYIVASLNETDMTPQYEVLKSKFGDNSGYRKYNDVLHGFAGATGNWSNPVVWQRVEQTIDILGNFCVRNLPNQ